MGDHVITNASDPPRAVRIAGHLLLAGNKLRIDFAKLSASDKDALRNGSGLTVVPLLPTENAFGEPTSLLNQVRTLAVRSMRQSDEGAIPGKRALALNLCCAAVIQGDYAGETIALDKKRIREVIQVQSTVTATGAPGDPFVIPALDYEVTVDGKLTLLVDYTGHTLLVLFIVRP